MGVDWVQLSRVLGVPASDPAPRGFDWVVWEEDDGLIVAEYVFPRSPAAEAGLQEGDVFYQLDYQQYFNLEDLQRAIDGVPPGSVRTYYVMRGDQMRDVDVRFTRYPTFLYPLSTSLWQFSVWGFVLGAFLHVLGLIIAAPLASRSRQALFSLVLVAVSALWVVGNLLRLLLIEVTGPCAPGSWLDHTFQGLTLVGLVGWIGFPALLLHRVLHDARQLGSASLIELRAGIYLPTLILAGAALVTTLGGTLGPLTLDSLAAPILFYACCYIATAAALVLVLHAVRPEAAEDRIGRWSKAGSAVMLALGLLFGLSVLGVVPLFGFVTDTTAGWLIVGAQLLFVGPVVLVAHASLKHGKIDQVFSRALTYLTVLGLIFFAFVGGTTLVEPYLERLRIPRVVGEGVFVVLLLIVFERIARRMRVYATTFFATDRQRARQRLSRFQEQMRTILDHEDLLRATIETVGEAFQVRSARLFVRPRGLSSPWLSAAYHPEPPYFTERVLSMVWPHFQREGAIWSRNPELNESTLPSDLADLLASRRVVLAIPILGEDAAVGLMVLGEKRPRRAVYNLEDVDLLRSLSGQLALAVERLDLVERERVLIRESAEAQLKALRAQINPHFLFNALNTIVSLIEEHPEDAVEVVEHLSAIFRHILQTGGQPFVAVQDEFALVSHYLSIEQARFGERLQIEQHLDPAVQAYPVPAFAVQTLVENAVKHGLEVQRGGGTVRLTAERASDELVEIRVSDTGVGLPALFDADEQVVDTDAAFLGIGLRNVAARLERLYDRSDLLRMRSAPDAGTTVRLLLPPVPTPTPADGTLHPAAAP
ncbi:MAG: PDZ domain-containing protein [Bacteroidetes bacterium]|nr:PDZ domain-containing protein [Bacteroidota bacterium]